MALFSDYATYFSEYVLPNLRESGVCVIVYTGNVDLKLAADLGAGLLLDKPLLVVGVRGAELPAKLVRAADAVLHVWEPGNPETEKQLTAAVLRLLHRDEPGAV